MQVYCPVSIAGIMDSTADQSLLASKVVTMQSPEKLHNNIKLD